MLHLNGLLRAAAGHLEVAGLRVGAAVERELPRRA